MEKIKIDISWSGDNYCAGTGNINGAVIVTNKTLSGVKMDFAEALQFHIDGSIEDGDELPDFIKNKDFELDFNLQVSALLHKLDGVITRAALSRATGINERQLGHYIQGKKEPRPETQLKIKKGIKKISEELAESIV